MAFVIKEPIVAISRYTFSGRFGGCKGEGRKGCAFDQTDRFEQIVAGHKGRSVGQMLEGRNGVGFCAARSHDGLVKDMAFVVNVPFLVVMGIRTQNSNGICISLDNCVKYFVAITQMCFTRNGPPWFRRFNGEKGIVLNDIVFVV